MKTDGATDSILRCPAPSLYSIVTQDASFDISIELTRPASSAARMVAFLSFMTLRIDYTLYSDVLGLAGEKVPLGHPDRAVNTANHLVIDGDHGLSGLAVDGEDHAGGEGLADLSLQVLGLALRDELRINVPTAQGDRGFTDLLCDVAVTAVVDGVIDVAVADAELLCQLLAGLRR